MTASESPILSLVVLLTIHKVHFNGACAGGIHSWLEERGSEGHLSSHVGHTAANLMIFRSHDMFRVKLHLTLNILEVILQVGCSEVNEI